MYSLYDEPLTIPLRSAFFDYVWKFDDREPQAIMREQVARSREQVAALIEDLENILENDDEYLRKWWFKYADWWPEGYDLRVELEDTLKHAIEKLPNVPLHSLKK